MKKSLLIVSMDSTVLSWKTRKAKLDAITKALNGTKNATWEVTLVYQSGIKPAVIDGRITHAWFDSFAHPLFNAGNHHIFLHMSKAQWEKLGLQHTLRGANQIDKDFVGDSYGWADEKTVRTRGQNQFVQVVLHELSHELARATKVQDLTHSYHDAHADISGIFTRYDMNDWHPVYQAGMSKIAILMAKLAELVARKPATTLYHPVQYMPCIISQGYGIRSTRYKLTGRHIGTDYAIPVDTSIYAPYDGTVTFADTGDATGHYCLFRYSFQGEVYEERWCHLSKLPKLGSYKRGAMVAMSGNTGTSTGPHLHREVWKGKVDLATITSKNWSQVTLDPESLNYSK